MADFEENKLGDEERQKCEVWTRVMGYYRPTSAFNKGKQSEFMDRKCYSEDKASEGK
jgi:anaerobic ribonucleoside-triphosphate reductase